LNPIHDKPANEISEVYALLDVMKVIKIKESELKQKELIKARKC